MNEINNSKITEIGLINSNWKIMKLMDITECIIDCLHAKKPNFIQYGNKIFLEVSNIGDDGFLDLRNKKYITNEDYEKWTSRLKPRKNDIVITKTGRVGSVAILDSDNSFCIGRNQVLIRCNSKIVLPEFLLLYLLSPLFKGELRRLTIDGTILKSLHVKYIPEIRVPIPNIDEQKSIINLLYSIIKRMNILKKINSILENICQIIFYNLFISFRINSNLEFEENKLNLQLKSRKKIPIIDLADYVNGKAFTKLATPNGKAIVKISELKNGIGNTTKYYNGKVSNDNIAYFDDILFAWSASLGIYRWFGDASVINQHIFKVIPKDYPKWYIYYQLHFAMPWFISIAEGKTTTMGHINRSHLKEYKILIPNKDYLEETDKIIRPFYEKIGINNKEINLLIKINNLILPQLVTGRLRIKDYEKFMER